MTRNAHGEVVAVSRPVVIAVVTVLLTAVAFGTFYLVTWAGSPRATTVHVTASVPTGGRITVTTKNRDGSKSEAQVINGTSIDTDMAVQQTQLLSYRGALTIKVDTGDAGGSATCTITGGGDPQSSSVEGRNGSAECRW